MRITGHSVSACAIFVCLWALLSLPASAQPSPDTTEAAPRPATPSLRHPFAAENEIGFFGTIPVGNGSYKAEAMDRQFFIFGFSYSRLLVHSRFFDVRWVSEIMPAEFLREPYVKGTRVQTLSAIPSITETKVTYGMGSNPVGMDLFFLPHRKWQPFAGAHGGFSYFGRNILSPQAAQFNFLLDGRAGLRYTLEGRRAISVSYRFQHLSNAYTAVDNPGLDVHMVQVAYSFPFHFWRGQ